MANLLAFFHYAQLLNMVALDMDLMKEVAVQKLLGIQPSTTNELFVPAHTEFYDLLRKAQMCLREIHDGITIPMKSLTQVIMESFHKYLLQTLSQVGTVESMPLATRLLDPASLSMPLTQIIWNNLYASRPDKQAFAEVQIQAHYSRFLPILGVADRASVRYVT